MVAMLALLGMQGSVLCLGQDGHVDVGGADCHDASHDAPGTATEAGGDDCCTDIVLPAVEARVKGPRVEKRLADTTARVGVVCGLALPVDPCAALGDAAGCCFLIDRAPPPAVRTTVLQL